MHHHLPCPTKLTAAHKAIPHQSGKQNMLQDGMSKLCKHPLLAFKVPGARFPQASSCDLGGERGDMENGHL